MSDSTDTSDATTTSTTDAADDAGRAPTRIRRRRRTRTTADTPADSAAGGEASETAGESTATSTKAAPSARRGDQRKPSQARTRSKTTAVADDDARADERAAATAKADKAKAGKAKADKADKADRADKAKAGKGDAGDAEDDAKADGDGSDVGDGGDDTGEGGASSTPRRRRRGGRGRRGRGKSRSGGGDSSDGTSRAGDDGDAEAGKADGDAATRSKKPAGDDDTEDDANKGKQNGDTKAKSDTKTDKKADDDKAADRPGSTRIAARSGRGRSAGGRGRGGRSGRGRKPVSTVSEETRRAIAEGPPRKMLVTVGEQRTQIAVLEDRRLMEHFVTRKEDVSYVGNIYMGRIQNVLPGMEAAFVDVGKGRNGVLYAGEVDYDAADLDGEPPRIEEALKQGQSVLVQVTKDPMGSKGARLTQQLSVAGRYCVLAAGDGILGISRKLPDDERERLRKILKAIKPEGHGLIVRTAAEGATSEQLEADVARLVRIWDRIEEKAKKAKALDAVYEEPGLVIRVIRDVFSPEYTDLIIDDAELAEQVREYLGDVAPEMVDKVSVYTPSEETGGGTLFEAYEVSTQVRRALEKKVWLPSGGYLIIEKTEAMWVIDVNTGKFVGKDNLEETVLKNNLEAADEIARQLRLRDMGGIIVIDFVDMLVPSNRDEVLKRFKRELARDKTKSRVMTISKLGLIEMTRKNVSQGLTESFTSKCPTCEGRGATILEEFS